jgi:SAM-dependent methyltransferase
MPARVASGDGTDLYARAVSPIDAGAAPPIPVGACLVCTEERARPTFAIEGVASALVVCEGCGLGRLHPLPDAEEVRGYYPGRYYGDLGSKFRLPVESLVHVVARRHVSFLSRELPRGARILDVGCGRGVILGALADRGFEAHGFEISADAARGADGRAHIRIADELAEVGYPDAHFDGVILWHVIEHVRDPAGALAEIARVLKPGGRLVVAVPNFSSIQARWAGPAWFHLDLPRHLYHFPLGALRALLRRTGFEIRSEHHFSLRQNPFGWIQSWLNRRGDLPRNGLYTLLYQRGERAPAPFDAATRRKLLGGLLLGALPALALSTFAALARSGATVHVVAFRQSGPQP